MSANHTLSQNHTAGLLQTCLFPWVCTSLILNISCIYLYIWTQNCNEKNVSLKKSIVPSTTTIIILTIFENEYGNM